MVFNLLNQGSITSNFFWVVDEFNAPVMSESKKGDYLVFLPGLEKRHFRGS